MELRESRTRRNPIPLLLTFFFFTSQFHAATPQILSLNFSYRSSTKSPPVSSPPPPAAAATSPPAVNATGRWRRKRPNRTVVEFLNAHNVVRKRVGEPPLEWNGKLAAYARSWARKRVNDCRLLHSNGPFGENIFWGGQKHWRAREVVGIWAEENKFYDVKANACEPNKMCGHYTQMVWRESTMVGCAREECSDGGIYVICVYNPPGNYEGENPFASYNDQTNISRQDPPATVAQSSQP